MHESLKRCCLLFFIMFIHNQIISIFNLITFYNYYVMSAKYFLLSSIILSCSYPWSWLDPFHLLIPFNLIICIMYIQRRRLYLLSGILYITFICRGNLLVIMYISSIYSSFLPIELKLSSVCELGKRSSFGCFLGQMLLFIRVSLLGYGRD